MDLQGNKFIETIKGIGVEGIKAIQSEFLELLFNDEKMQKQSMSLSIVLTADKIATDYLFKDKAFLWMRQNKS